MANMPQPSNPPFSIINVYKIQRIESMAIIKKGDVINSLFFCIIKSKEPLN
jgi:hypothetical protein